MSAAEGSDITDEQIHALWDVLREEMDPYPYMARVENFEKDPRGFLTKAGRAALRAADEEADRKNYDLYRRALAAFLDARHGPVPACPEPTRGD
jgi:hypothetical protein